MLMFVFKEAIVIIPNNRDKKRRKMVKMANFGMSNVYYQNSQRFCF